MKFYKTKVGLFGPEIIGTTIPSIMKEKRNINSLYVDGKINKDQKEMAHTVLDLFLQAAGELE